MQVHVFVPVLWSLMSLSNMLLLVGAIHLRLVLFAQLLASGALAALFQQASKLLNTDLTFVDKGHDVSVLTASGFWLVHCPNRNGGFTMKTMKSHFGLFGLHFRISVHVCRKMVYASGLEDP